MKIDWAALGEVAAVSLVMTVVFVTLLSFGIRLVSTARARTDRGEAGNRVQAAGYALLGGAGLLVLYGIYLIVPVFD